MKAGNMLKHPLSIVGLWMACWMWMGAVVQGQSESILTSGSLGAVEYRALLAQSLTQQVEEMKGESDILRKQLADKESLLQDALKSLGESRKEVETLQKNLAEWEAELSKRDQLLAVFRRGAFEYYEVRAGDTLESIAANPMVYGDSNRATWLRQANTVSEKNPLEPGTVLVIPRFPEGTSSDL